MVFGKPKKIAALASLMCLALAQGVWAAPAAPTGLSVPTLSQTETGMTLIWERPAKGDDVVGYKVYMDDKLIAQTDKEFSSTAKREIRDYYTASPQAQKVVNHLYHVTGLTADSKHSFAVRAVDANGQESPDSNKITASTRKPGTTIDIRTLGAVGDGKTVNTRAIQQAIDACPAGGTIIVPAGVFKTGSIWLKSNITLEIQKDGVILGSDNPADYPYHYKLYPYLSDERYYALIDAKPGNDGEKLQNIRIVGEGTIDGNGWKKGADGNYLYRERGKKGEPLPANHVSKIGILAAKQVAALEKAYGLDENKAYPRRSSLVLLQGVDHVYLQGVTLRNPANHTFIAQHCDDVVVDGAKFMTYNCNNGDGIEFGHGKGLKVFDCVFDTGDDCVNFAAGQGAIGEKDAPTQNIWIFNNSFHHGHGAVVMGSHTAAYIQNLLAEDNVIDGCEVGLRMKTNPINGGGARNITFRYNAARNLEKNFFIATTAYSDPNAKASFPKASKTGCFYNVRVENCTVEGTGKAAIEIVGQPDAKHHDIRFTNVTIANGKPWIMTDAENISFDDVQQTDAAINQF